MELHFKIIGVLLITLAFAHITFPRYFNWRQELNFVSLINRQMMYVHALFIAIAIFLMGLLCFTSANELLTTALGRKISFGFALFWTARLIIQFVGYSFKLWKGKRFETVVHVLFSVFWVYLVTIFWLSYGMNDVS